LRVAYRPRPFRSPTTGGLSEARKQCYSDGSWIVNIDDSKESKTVSYDSIQIAAHFELALASSGLSQSERGGLNDERLRGMNLLRKRRHFPHTEESA
jgi:hypothetical protein